MNARAHGERADRGARIPVLFLSAPIQPPLGADTWVHTLLMRHLDRERVKVHVACAFGPPGQRTPTFEAVSRIPDVELLPIDLGPELFGLSRAEKLRAAAGSVVALRSFVELVRYVREHRIRIIHTTERPRDALVSVLLGRATGARSLVHLHVAYGSWMGGMRRWSLEHADARIGVSAFVRRTLVDAGFESGTTYAALNALELSDWNPDLQPGPVRDELGVPRDAPLIACVARIFEGKGQMKLVRALPAVRREVPGVRLLIVGRDYGGSAGTDALRAEARALGVADAVTFTGQRSDVGRIMAACDVFAMPSHEEPFGLVYAEAMAMRRPVVGLDSGGVPEVVTHGVDGLLSAPGDDAALARHLVTLLADPDLRARMGAAGRRNVEQRFAPGRLAEDVARIYDSVLGA